MLSRSLARSRVARSPLVLAVACAVSFLVVGPADAAREHLTNVATDASHPESEILGGGTLEGDIWGGEQITTPAPNGTVRETMLAANTSTGTTVLPAWLGWWTRLLDLLRLFVR